MRGVSGGADAGDTGGAVENAVCEIRPRGDKCGNGVQLATDHVQVVVTQVESAVIGKAAEDDRRRLETLVAGAKVTSALSPMDKPIPFPVEIDPVTFNVVEGDTLICVPVERFTLAKLAVATLIAPVPVELIVPPEMLELTMETELVESVLI